MSQSHAFSTRSPPLGNADWWLPATARSRAAATRSGRTPYVATLLLLFVVIVAPQEQVPALAPFRIALLAAGLAVSAHLYDRFRRGAGLAALPRQLGIVAVLLAWAITTLPLSFWPGGSVAFLGDVYLKTIVVFWLLAATVDTSERAMGAVGAMTLMGMPLALTAIRNFAFDFLLKDDPARDRIAGYHGGMASNPNDLALTLNLLLPLAVALVAQARSVAARLLVVGVVACYVAGVVVTFSRGGFVTLVTIFTCYIVAFFRRAQWRAVLGCLALAAVAIAAFPEGYAGRLATMTAIDSDATGSAQARWTDTLAALQCIEERPIVGSGIGMNILALGEQRGDTGRAVHNVYLQYAVELGLPGLALFLWLYASCLRTVASAARAAEAARASGVRAIADGVRVSLLAFGVAALFHPVAYQFYFYLIAGLAVAVGGVCERHPASRVTRPVVTTTPDELWWQAGTAGGLKW